ncbi:MAG: polyprenyl synthetase family protein [Acidobacteria bacterium]|nr:polyprenyl synthetase family protein [Acidobacteriota bacterium]MBI3658638.1 polyprenyl synthetase family protein [Acidobacteriota bacterium]
MQYQELFDYLGEVEKRLAGFLRASDVPKYFNPEDISESVFSYIGRPAKRLRPAVLLMASGALGGPQRERLSLPAAAGVELFHTWTLVHDDLIDHDTLRRGGPTVHEAVRGRARVREALPDHLAAEYGRNVAILTGDVQHGWSIASFADCGLQPEVNGALVLKLIKHLQSYVLDNLIFGEVLDVRYGMRKLAELPEVDEAKIVEMLWLKTGVLYEFAGMAGALLGKNTDDFEDDEVQAVTHFASKCGTAFQLQDDILGILGDEATLGKPVGSDIREGKKTVIVYETLRNGTEAQRKTVLSALGNRSATAQEVQVVKQLFYDLNGIRRTKELAGRYIEEAIPYLDLIPESPYKHKLLLWANYMLDRKF